MGKKQRKPAKGLAGVDQQTTFEIDDLDKPAVPVPDPLDGVTRMLYVVIIATAFAVLIGIIWLTALEKLPVVAAIPAMAADVVLATLGLASLNPVRSARMAELLGTATKFFREGH